MRSVCQIFESKGFLTPQSTSREKDRPMDTGFIHSLGHGLGLTIGEMPYLSNHSRELLKEGHVTTVEPGLYDPSIGGIRIEDVVVLSNGSSDNITDLDKILEI